MSLCIVIAWLTSLLRMTAIAVSLNSLMAQPLTLPVLAAASVLGAGAILFSIRSTKEQDGGAHMFQNPLDLKFVLGLGALIAVIVVAAKIASDRFGQAGLLTVAGITGFADVDPVTLSTARLAGVSVTPQNAAQAILLAAAANVLTKVVATWLGGWRFALPLTVAGVLTIGAGATALFFFGT